MTCGETAGGHSTAGPHTCGCMFRRVSMVWCIPVTVHSSPRGLSGDHVRTNPGTPWGVPCPIDEVTKLRTVSLMPNAPPPAQPLRLRTHRLVVPAVVHDPRVIVVVLFGVSYEEPSFMSKARQPTAPGAVVNDEVRVCRADLRHGLQVTANAGTTLFRQLACSIGVYVSVRQHEGDRHFAYRYTG